MDELATLYDPFVVTTIPNTWSATAACQAGYAYSLNFHAPFPPLRFDTTRAAATAIVRRIDEADAPRVAEQAAAHARAALPGPRVTICLYAAAFTGPMPYLAGVGGVSLGGGRIKIWLHPTEDRFAKLPYTVAHEYHHEAARQVRSATTVEEILVSEGAADHFAVSLYPKLRPPHTDPLSDAELAVVWPALARQSARRAWKLPKRLHDCRRSQGAPLVGLPVGLRDGGGVSQVVSRWVA